MAGGPYHIDQNADTVIILKNACPKFATYEYDVEWRKYSDIIRAKGGDPNAIWRGPIAVATGKNTGDGHGTKGKRTESAVRSLGETQQDGNGRTSATQAHQTTQEVDNISMVPDMATCHDVKFDISQDATIDSSQDMTLDTAKYEAPTVEYFVSSRHLQVGSALFQRAMSGERFMEGRRTTSDGMFRIDVEGWDEESLLLLLNMWHLQCDSVPSTLTLESMAKLAALVDYYDCAFRIRIWTEKWTKHLQEFEPLPTTRGRNLIMWICVAWHFEMKEQFKEVTKKAILWCYTKKMQHCDLPIPDRIVDEIENRRLQGIEHIMSRLYRGLELFENDTYRCSSATSNTDITLNCSSVLLGALRTRMRQLGYTPSRPEVPFDGLSIQSVYRAVLKFDSPTWNEVPLGRDDSKSKSYVLAHKTHGCTLAQIIRPAIKTWYENLAGLNLSDFRTQRA